MRFSDQFRTGWRNLSRQKLRTTLTVFAIVIGAVSVTVMLTLVTSAQGFLTTSFQKTGEDRRVIVTPNVGTSYREASWSNNSDGTGKRLTDDLVKQYGQIVGVKSASPVTSFGWQFATVKNDKAEIPFKNINAVAYDGNGTITRDLLEGTNLTADDNSGGALITSGIANNLGYRGNLKAMIGTMITLTPNAQNGNQSNKNVTLTVKGIYTADGEYVDVTMAQARKLVPPHEQCQGSQNQKPVCTVQSDLDRNGYGAIYLNVGDKKQVDVVIAAVKTTGAGAAAGKDEVQTQQRVFTILGLVLGGIGGIALFVAAIGVINTMVMATLERTREIGIMRAIGATKKSIRRLFTVEAGVLGFVGGAVGVGVSFGVTVLLNKLINNQLAKNGVTSRNVISVPPLLALVVIAVTTGIGMLAGRLPARRAANLDPVEALRYE